MMEIFMRERPLVEIETMLIKDEGFRQHMYLDSKHVHTIGVGHNLDDMPISDRAVIVILEDDIKQVREEIALHFPWSEDLPDNLYLVLESMRFQLGLTRLLGFHEFLKACKMQDRPTMRKEMLDSEWARKDSPARALELANIELKEGE
jgi:GH24 family phage-related lysozyme (muramidase)